ncbi:MAG: hypothetical protein JSW21_07460 [Gammaproteobacteria bacterium]|nr:MAG: hypothetical protein JSW21_07460 [Gammaproteobacteria bacterium]
MARPAYATTEPDVSNTYLFTLIAIAIGVTVLMDRFSRTLLRVFDHPRWLRFVALMGAVSLLLLYRSQSDRMAWSSEALIGLVFALLAYLAVRPMLSISLDAVSGKRQTALMVLGRALFALNIVLAGLWFVRAPPFAGIQPSVRPILLSEIALLALLHQSLITSHLRALDRMRGEIKLFALWATLAAFLVCLSSPLAMYASSEDFSGSPLYLADSLLINFVVVVASLAILFVVLEDRLRKLLAITLVFFTACYFVYSAITDAGLLSHFILRDTDPLILSSGQKRAEIAVLLAVFLMTAAITIYLAQIVIWMGAATLFSAVVMTLMFTYQSVQEYRARPDPPPVNHGKIMAFSAQRNVLIIMLDGFSGSVVGAIRESAAEILEPFEGFVWYPNTLSTSTATWSSAAALAGGHRFTVEAINSRQQHSLGDAFREAYSVFPDAFIPHGFDVSYVDPQYSGGCARVDDRVHCTEMDPYGQYHHGKHGQDALFARMNLPLALTAVSLYNAAPFFLKLRIYDRGRWLGANAVGGSAYLFKVADWGFLQALARESQFRSASPTLKYVQLQIPHYPVALSADCVLAPEVASFAAESRCALQEIGLLLDRMKKAGAYDNTKIVIVSDHGNWTDTTTFSPDFEDFVPSGYQGRISPGVIQGLLLVKDFGATGALTRSDLFLSNADVPAIVCAAIESCPGVTPDPIAKNDSDRTLTVTTTEYPIDIASTGQFTIKDQYEVNHSIFDYRNWKKIQ